MPIGQGNKTAWSEAEKLSLFAQLIEQIGTINWDVVQLPEGRTLLAAKKLLSKMPKTGGDGSAPASNKRAADTTVDGAGPEKKAKAGRKKKAKAGEGEEEDTEKVDEKLVKDESEEAAFQ